MKTAFFTHALKDEDATIDFGRRLAPFLQSGDVVQLVGDVGAGKTTFVRSLIRKLHQDQQLEVPSPTFALVQQYHAAGGLDIWHLDLYRMERPEELWELGVEEAFEEALCFIEWPDHAQGLLPETSLVIRIEPDRRVLNPHAKKTGRIIHLSSSDNQWHDRLHPMLETIPKDNIYKD